MIEMFKKAAALLSPPSSKNVPKKQIAPLYYSKAKENDVETVGEGQKRKTRSDKKKEVQPALPRYVHDWIIAENEVTEMPIKDIGESLLQEALENNLQDLQRYFVRSVQIGRSWYASANEDDRMKIRRFHYGSPRRISVRLKKEDYERVSQLAYAAGCSISHMSSVLIQMGAVERDKQYRTLSTHKNGWATYLHPSLQSASIIAR